MTSNQPRHPLSAEELNALLQGDELFTQYYPYPLRLLSTIVMLLEQLEQARRGNQEHPRG